MARALLPCQSGSACMLGRAPSSCCSTTPHLPTSLHEAGRGAAWLRQRSAGAAEWVCGYSTNYTDRCSYGHSAVNSATKGPQPATMASAKASRACLLNWASWDWPRTRPPWCTCRMRVPLHCCHHSRVVPYTSGILSGPPRLPKRPPCRPQPQLEPHTGGATPVCLASRLCQVQLCGSGGSSSLSRPQQRRRP